MEFVDYWKLFIYLSNYQLALAVCISHLLIISTMYQLDRSLKEQTKKQSSKLPHFTIYDAFRRM